jgi:hypothetical protein
MLKAMGLGPGFVRAAQEQAIETTEASGPTFQRCAALLATAGLIFQYRYKRYPSRVSGGLKNELVRVPTLLQA